MKKSTYSVDYIYTRKLSPVADHFVPMIQKDSDEYRFAYLKHSEMIAQEALSQGNENNKEGTSGPSLFCFNS